MNNKIELKNVTILCVDGVNPDIGLKALKYSMKHIIFGKSILLSHINPGNISDNIIFEQIPKLTHDTYSQFMLHELYKYVDTDYCLTIHDDGFVSSYILYSINQHKHGCRQLNNSHERSIRINRKL